MDFIPAVAHPMHYVDPDGACRAAIVTGLGYHTTGEVDLVVFHRDRTEFVSRVSNGAVHEPGTWHWPDR